MDSVGVLDTDKTRVYFVLLALDSTLRAEGAASKGEFGQENRRRSATPPRGGRRSVVGFTRLLFSEPTPHRLASSPLDGRLLRFPMASSTCVGGGRSHGKAMESGDPWSLSLPSFYLQPNVFVCVCVCVCLRARASFYGRRFSLASNGEEACGAQILGPVGLVRHDDRWGGTRNFTSGSRRGKANGVGRRR